MLADRRRRLARFQEEQLVGDEAHSVTLEHHERGRYSTSILRNYT